MNRKFCRISCLIIYFNIACQTINAQNSENKLNEIIAIIASLETKLEEACKDADNNLLTGKKIYPVHKATINFPDITIIISKDNFNQDLEKGLILLDKFNREKQNIIKAQNNKQKQKQKINKNKAVRPEDALRRSERKTAQQDKSKPANTIQVVNIYEDYEKGIKARQGQADKMAEADMMRINEERRMAEAELKAKEEAEQKIQEQNRRWQKELDNQAEKAAQEALAWKRKYGAGAFFKNIFRTAISGTVSSLTGGLAGSIGSGAADILMRKKFPEFTPSGKFDKELNE